MMEESGICTGYVHTSKWPSQEQQFGGLKLEMGLCSTC